MMEMRFPKQWITNHGNEPGFIQPCVDKREAETFFARYLVINDKPYVSALIEQYRDHTINAEWRVVIIFEHDDNTP